MKTKNITTAMFAIFGCINYAFLQTTINPGTISASQVVCNGLIPTQLNEVSAPTRGTGPYTFQWEEQINCTGAWTPILGATSANYQPAALSQNTCFRRKVTDNAGNVSHSLPVTLSTNLKAYYSFDKNVSSGNVEDLTGNGYTATLPTSGSPSWVSNGFSGGAYQFDGGDSINIPNPLSGQIWTVTAWINISDLNYTSEQYLVKGMNKGNLINTNVISGYPNCSMLYLNDGSNNYYFNSNKEIITANVWHQIAFVFDNTTADRRIYLDGQLINMSGSVGVNSTGIPGNPSGLLSTFELGVGVKGMIDEVRFYDAALTRIQIQGLYNAKSVEISVENQVSAPTINASSISVCHGTSVQLTIPDSNPTLTSFSGDFYSQSLPSGWESFLNPAQAPPNDEKNIGGNPGVPAVLNKNTIPFDTLIPNGHYILINLPFVGSSKLLYWRMAANGTNSPASGFVGKLRVQYFDGTVWDDMATFDQTQMFKSSPPGSGGSTSESVGIPNIASQVRFIVTDRTAGRMILDSIGIISDWNWYTTCGSSAIQTGDTLDVTPSATTTYYAGVKQAVCPANCSSKTITLPTISGNLSGNLESATCYISGNNPIDFFNTTTGNYIGSINPNGRSGTITMTSYVHSFGSNPGVDDGTMYACNSPTNELYRTAFMERSFKVITDATGISGSGNLEAFLPFSATEYANLQTASTGKTIGNNYDNVSALTDLVVTKYDTISGLGVEDGNPYNNCTNGTSVVVTQNSSGSTLTNGSNYNISSSVTAEYASFLVSDFSEFDLHGLNQNFPLPVELTAFSATCKNESTILNWTTASETNLNHYEIERSRDGHNWSNSGIVQAAGNSSKKNQYQFTDNNHPGIIYYRLKSIDNNGDFKYYGPISTICNDNENEWSFYPNPVKSDATLSIVTREASRSQINIVDVMGRIVFGKEIELNSGNNLINLDLRDISGGSYFVDIVGKRELKPIRFIKSVR